MSDPVSLLDTRLTEYMASFMGAVGTREGWDLRRLSVFRLDSEVLNVRWRAGHVVRALIAPGVNRWGHPVFLAGVAVMHTATWDWACGHRGDRRGRYDGEGLILAATRHLVVTAVLPRGTEPPLLCRQDVLERPARLAVDRALEVTRVALGMSVLSQDFPA